MSLKGYIEALKRLVDEDLDRHLPGSCCEPKVIHRAMRYSIFSGGKRIRPIIVLEACKVCDGGRRHMADALVIASAVEMVHTYSLIHDDLPSMDDDDYRRGKLSNHKKFGEANAILAGDALLTLAFNVMANDLEAGTGIAAVKELSDAIGIYGMVGGQAMDISLKNRPAIPSVQNHINSLKTARLFEASARLGAIASCATEKKVKAMADFGYSFGVSFQLVDDIMDNDGFSHSPARLVKMRGLAVGATSRAINALDAFGADADRLRELATLMLNPIRSYSGITVRRSNGVKRGV